MRKTTLAISSVLGILLLALMVACSGELDRDGSTSMEEAAGGDGSTNLSAEGDDGQRPFNALEPYAADTVLGGLPDSAGMGSPDSGGEAGPQLSGLLDRKIIRTATLDLTVEDVAGGMQEVERIANAAGGFVSGSSLSLINPGSDDEELRVAAIVEHDEEGVPRADGVVYSDGDHGDRAGVGFLTERLEGRVRDLAAETWHRHGRRAEGGILARVSRV